MFSSFSGKGLGCFLVRLDWAWGDSCVFSPAYTPPRTVPGRHLVNGAIKLRLRTVVFSCYYLFRPADLPPLGAGGDLGILVTPTVAQDWITPYFLLFGGVTSPRPPSLRLWRYFGFTFPSTHSRPVPPLSGNVAAVFLDVFPVPYG